MRPIRLIATVLIALAGMPRIAAAATPPLPRASFAQPAISPDGSTIAFVSGGAIWEVPASGGVAHILVADKGADSRPLFSPDGKHLAFVSDATGGGDVYVLDLATGKLSRVTHADGHDQLSGWSHDGQWVYFNSARDNIGGMNGVYRVRITGGTPMPVSLEPYRYEEQGVPSPDNQSIALVGGGWGETQWWRHGSAHIDHGAIWLLANDGSHTYRRLTPDDARADWPMWAPDGQSLYYVSDRSGTENIWHVDRKGSEVPLTHFTSGRVVWPTIAADGRTIAFERDFGIWTVDTATGKAHMVPITLVGAIASPQDQHQTKHDDFHDLRLSPDGKKLAFIVHGDIYAVGTKKGGHAELVTRTPGVAYGIAWAPDSRRIVYGDFRAGSEHLYLYDFRSGKETPLTHGSGADTSPAFSPDGKSLAFLRDGHKLEVIDMATHAVRALTRANIDFPRPMNSDRPLTWSPDGRWIAVLEWGPRMFRNAVAVSVATGRTVAVSMLANTFSDDLTFSPDGKQLLFTTGERTKQGQIASIDLVARTPHFREDQFLKLFKPSKPGEPPDQEQAESSSDHGKSAAKPAHEKNEPVHVRIDATAIRNRLTLLPTGLDAQAIAISPDGKSLVITANVAGHTNLYAWSLDPLADKPAVARQLTSSKGYKADVQFSPDGKTIWYLDDGRVHKVALEKGKAKAVAIEATVDADFATDKMLSFAQAWTWLRDNYQNPAMNGVDWNAMRARYEPLLAGAPTWASVNRLMNMLVGELDSSHSGVRRRKHHDPVTGRLGLRFDTAAYEHAGKLRVTGVTPLSPAAIAGIKPGAVLEAVNHHVLDRHDNLFALLAHRIGHKTTLRVTSGQRTRTLEVKPIDSRTLALLNYKAWVNANRAYVAKLSGGKLGYVHLPDMSMASLHRLYRELDADNMTREGVVIDVRNNYGGFVNAYALDVLARKAYLNMTPRNIGHPVPARSLLGQRALERPTVLVTNRITLSDGEDFTEGYRAMHLGKVVGEPTAGWIIFTSAGRLIDGATVRLPFSTITTAGGKPMERHPRPVDVPVERPLGESYRGKDSDLDAAAKVLLQQVQQQDRRRTRPISSR